MRRPLTRQPCRLLPRPRLFAAGAIAASLLGACTSLEEPAATVAGAVISEDAIDEELEAVTASPDYQAALERQFGTPVQGSGEGTYATDFVAQLLSLRVYFELIEAELDERGVEITEEDRDTVRDQAVEVVGGQEAFDALPAAYRDRLVEQRALLAAAGDAFTADEPDEGAAEEFYEANRADFETRCLAHVLVGTDDEAQPTGERTRPEAQARADELAAELAGGADFTELASSEANDDTVSAAEGGDLGCITRQTQFDPVFLDAAFAADVGEVTEPVETQFGFHLILVSSAEVPAFDDVEAQIDEILAGGEDPFNAFLVEATCERDIEVASKYGSWDTTRCDGGGIGLVLPPTGPSPPPGDVPDGGAPGEGAPGEGASDGDG